MDIKLPRLGEGADSGTVAGLFVKEGDYVKTGQPVLELESDKAVASIPSPATGRVAKIFVKEGDEIKVGQLILSLDADGSATRAGMKKEGAAGSTATAPAEEEEGAHLDVAPEPVPLPDVVPEAEVGEPVQTAGEVPPASPSVRKIARELGIDLRRIHGSERGGRIVLQDVKRYVQRLQQLAQQPKPVPQGQGVPVQVLRESIDFSRWGPVVKKRMSTLRRTISGRMAAAWTTIPHITQFDDADVTLMSELRRKYALRYEKKGGHLTLTVFVLKAVVGVLKKYEVFNASLDESGEEIVFKQYINIGIAVDTEQGLIVPVIKDVDKKSMLELAIELQALAERTRQRKVSIEEMQGGTFTISNQGGIGSGHFTPIINKPEVAILGVGRGTEKPVIVKNKVVRRTMLPVALSYDHRVIDGAEAARFMVDFVRALETFKESDLKT